MAIDRCIAIVTPLKAGKIRVSSNELFYLHIDLIFLGTVFMWWCMAFSWTFINTEYIYISFTY
jgi:hypothetical protein